MRIKLSRCETEACMTELAGLSSCEDVVWSRRDSVKVAQRFIAGNGGFPAIRSPGGTDDRILEARSSLRDLLTTLHPLPAMNRWASLNRPSGATHATPFARWIIRRNCRGPGVGRALKSPLFDSPDRVYSCLHVRNLERVWIP